MARALLLLEITMSYLQKTAPPRARTFPAALVVAWLFAAGAGVWAMLQWQNDPAPKAATVTSWPANFPIPLDANAANLVMVAHPKCPCSRASLAQLVKVLTRATPASARASILFYRPANEGDQWLSDSLWTAAEGIPGLRLISDPDGEWASRLGATASGHVFLFDGKGRLMFEGGITSGRGHEGENPGSSTICDLLAGRTPATSSTPVFGCTIADRLAAQASLR